MWVTILAWDCNLEDQAQDAAKACTAYNGKYGVNEKMFKANPCNITAETDKVLREWWDEVRNVELENGNKYNDQIKHFGVAYECKTFGKDALDKITNCEWPVPAATGNRPQNTHKIDQDWEISGQNALETAITAWYKELEESEGIGENPEYTQQMADAGKLSNFVNLAYEENTQVGCAFKNCPKQGYTLVACQYDKLITPDTIIYTAGKTCSKCADNNRKCETGNNGLCIP
ncbi:hypothetical protein ANCCEY_00847 [Ancylostoma ceylanicum]|uniref:SCP domain-containing protein n=1 Tax=Ancylostoma ceylanicum TaxID=53326 RepID=A0A0D6M789_9BILA|nr:hypothetical protein ANCCEY_00847 [Ancylostoma ceylanicum]